MGLYRKRKIKIIEGELYTPKGNSVNKSEYEKIQSVVNIKPTISVEEVSGEPRTLLWGYNFERHSWHVYWKNESIYLWIYSNEKEDGEFFEVSDSIDPHLLIPPKRLYPEACDYEFCRLLVFKGCDLCFTTLNDKREKKQFYGRIK